MAIDENIIFQTVYANHSDKPIEDVIAEVLKAKQAYANATERKVVSEPQAPVAVVEEKQEEVVEAPVAEHTKRLTRRSFKIKPEDAIHDDYIACCICGEKKEILTSAHFKKHQTTAEVYRRVCQYSEDLPLMSKNHLQKMQNTARKAQAIRKARQLSQKPAPSASATD